MRFKNNNDFVFTGKQIEVTIGECNGDFNKMLKKFTRKVRKEEVLKPFYDRLMFHTTRGQKIRAKKQKGTYNTRKKEQKNLEKE